MTELEALRKVADAAREHAEDHSPICLWERLERETREDTTCDCGIFRLRQALAEASQDNENMSTANPATIRTSPCPVMRNNLCKFYYCVGGKCYLLATEQGKNTEAIGAAAERSRIVAWLRDIAAKRGGESQGDLLFAARCIECGDHAPPA